jgi:hypothetical protein
MNCPDLVHVDGCMVALTVRADRGPLIVVYYHVFGRVRGLQPWFQWERPVGRTWPIYVIACLHTTP